MKTTVLGLTSFFILGCGGGGGNGSSGSPIAIENYSNEISTAVCAKTYECCTTSEIAERFSFFGGFANEADCVSKITAALAMNQTKFEASVAAGKIAYHDDLAGDCVADANTASCEAFNNSDGPGGDCDLFLEGLIVADMPCDIDEECVSGYCEGDNASMMTPGVCKPLPGVGDSCPDFRCESGSFCQFGSQSMCEAAKADGQSCGSDDACINTCNVVDDVGTCGEPTTCDGV